jgi:peptidase E
MAAERKPIILIAGGRRSVMQRGPDPLIQEALQLSGVPKPSVAYVGAASGDNPIFRAMMAKMLRKAGAGKIMPAPLCSARSNTQKSMRVIEECPVVFVSGGDVEEGMRVLEARKMIEFFRNQHRQGKLFIGASAGSIMLAKSWVRWSNSEDDSSAELFPCLGIAQVYCDTHDEEDWEELQALARLVSDGAISYGIPSGAALAAYPDGSVRALGEEVHRFTRKKETVVRISNLSLGSQIQNLVRPQTLTKIQ